VALNQLGLGFVFTAKDLASGVIGRVESSFTKMEGKTSAATRTVQSNFQQFGQGLAIFGAGVAIVGGAFALADKAGNFERALAEAGAAAGAGAREMEALRNAALDAGLAMTGFSAEEAAKTLSRLTREGLSARDAMAELVPSLTLATITGRSAEEAAGFLSDAVDTFHLSAADAGRVVDQLAVGMRTFGFMANELEPALKGIATGVQLTGASFEDAFIAVGLAKRVLPGVEQATRAANQAMLQLASPEVAKDLSRIGVTVKDNEGRLRPLVDILADVSERTAGMTEATRASTLSSIFSARAAGGLSVIMNQLGEGVRDASGTVLRGAAAVNFLRAELAGAGGAAEAMRDRLLDTFEGQKKVLLGSLSTLATVLGEPFAMVFKPIVRALAVAFNRIAEVIRAIPAPVKKALAAFTLAVGGVLALFGGFVAAKAGAVLLIAGLKAVGITIGGVLATMAPLLAAFAVLSLVVAGFAIAFKRDIGGIRTFFENAWARVKLLFQGLVQLFQEGAFSGAVMEELNRAENAGIKQFAIRVFQIVFRIRRFFEGLAEGFGAAIEAARPTFEAFAGALRELGEAFGLVSTTAAGAVAGIPSDRFAAKGAAIGEVFGKVVTLIVEGLTIVVRVVTGFIDGLRAAFDFFRPVFELVGEAIGFVAEEIEGLIGDLTGMTGQAREGGSVWRSIGEVLGWVASIIGTVLAGAIGVVALALRSVIWIVRQVIRGFVWLGETIGETVAKIYLFFTETIPRAFKAVATAVKSFFQPVIDFITGIVDGIRNVLDKMIGFVGKLVAKIPSRFRPAFLDSIVDAGREAESRIAERAARAAAPAAEAVMPGGAAALTPSGAVRAGGTLGAAAADAAMPAAAEVAARGEISDAELDAIVARGVALSEARPVQANITLNVDGEALARASARAERGAAARSFVPVPAPG
jgi:TP901 family phage tail tape measure protein